MDERLSRLRERLAGFFDLSDFLIPQAEAEQAIREGVSFRGTNILILIVAIFIASLGLNTNSTAVIIGAMLISPLMGPIIGIGLGVGVHDFELIKRAFRNLLMATVFSVATSCLFFLISPVNEQHSELLARTSPTIYDVFIGFFGGAAGILATGSRVKGNVLPGVAIATALMPPLCTVGYGIATLQPAYFLGALYLFFINSVFIACATTVGVWLMKYKVHDFSNPRRARRVRRAVYAVAIITMVPTFYLTWRMFRQSQFETECSRFVARECDFDGTQVLRSTADWDGGRRPALTISLVGRVLPHDSLLLALTSALPSYNLAGTTLRIIQGDDRAGLPDATQLSGEMLRDMYTVTQDRITRQAGEIDSLSAIVATAARNDTVSATLVPELAVLFPDVRDIAVSRAISADVATRALDTLDIALVTLDRPMPATAAQKFRDYLRARLSRPRLQVVSAPQREGCP
ncbi:MAG: DUF389 domain-containing protein [Muribaculaceae bacterium]|nr:DUF389 domain-containing protein [Muribaculaceae bacterium]